MVLPGVCPKADDVDIFFSGLQLLWFLDKVRLAWVGLMVSTIMNYSGMPADHSFSFFFVYSAENSCFFFLPGYEKRKALSPLLPKWTHWSSFKHRQQATLSRARVGCPK